MNKHKVILLDDDEGLCETWTQMLHRGGFDAKGYFEAERLLTEAFDARHPHEGQPDLVIIDLELGQGKMQGMELIKELSARDITSEILAVSGNLPAADLLRAMMIGASDWLAKPFPPSDVLMPKLASMAETGRKRRLHRGIDSLEMDVTRLNRPVFLSYSENDKILASVVKRYLEARDIGVWYAPSAIRVGDPWQDRIREGVKNAPIFVALLTDSYFTRPYCIHELMEFDQRVRTSPQPQPLLLPVTWGFSEEAKRNPMFLDIRSRYHCRDISGHQFLDGLTDLLLRIEGRLAGTRQRSDENRASA
jgi:FixJ family two-component response regulator